MHWRSRATHETSSSPEQLLALVAAGDGAALAQLYELTSPRLFGVALRTLKRRDLAEEVLHDAFLRIWDRAGSFTPEKGRAQSWMSIVVRHLAVDRLRRQREALMDPVGDVEAEPDGAPDPFGLALATAEGRALRACLQQLHELPRRCLLLAFYEGFTHAEIASRLDKPLGTVKSWLRRGLLQLKRCLEA
jgi:RNA polymerase sigma-70 factor (ECF subfamily)